MESGKIEFPLYRKYKNNKRYFKILNGETFEELQVIGSLVLRKMHVVRQYPEMILIKDLIQISGEGIESCPVKEYDAVWGISKEVGG